MPINAIKQQNVWTIAGSDSSGGAGIAADLLTFADFKVHGCMVITAVTAQNSQCVSHITYLDPHPVEAQISALATDMPAAAIKLGMLGTPKTIQVVSNFLQTFQGSVICDPVSVASTGNSLAQTSLKDALIQNLFPYLTLLTPNIPEAEHFLNATITTSQDMLHAAYALCRLGPQSVLLKGGHLPASSSAHDLWTDGTQHYWLSNKKYPHPHTHGSGCTLSAAITACLARGIALPKALILAKAYVSQGIRLAEQPGCGHGQLAHMGWPLQAEDFPWISQGETPSAMRLLREESPDFIGTIDTRIGFTK